MVFNTFVALLYILSHLVFYCIAVSDLPSVSVINPVEGLSIEALIFHLRGVGGAGVPPRPFLSLNLFIHYLQRCHLPPQPLVLLCQL